MRISQFRRLKNKSLFRELTVAYLEFSIDINTVWAQSIQVSVVPFGFHLDIEGLVNLLGSIRLPKPKLESFPKSVTLGQRDSLIIHLAIIEAFQQENQVRLKTVSVLTSLAHAADVVV